MRNFYVKADYEGRKTPLQGGPAGKYGNMGVDILWRDHGKSKVCVAIECISKADGKTLLVRVSDGVGNVIGEYEGER